VLSQASGPSRAERRELAARLLALQTSDGAWGWNADYPDPDLQATAEAVQALSLTREHARGAALRGAAWLAGQQLDTGGFPYGDAQESPLLDAEIVLALRLAGDPRADRAVSTGAPIASQLTAVELPLTADEPRLAAPF
jgi:hypothetical protein